MRSILEEFAYGNVSPQAQYFDKNSKYGRAIELVAEIDANLLDRLGAEDRDLFEQYVDAQGEANQLTAVKNLIYGYRLGLTMTAEACGGMDNLYAGGEDL